MYQESLLQNALKSDQSTQYGAIIIDHNTIVGTGFN